MDKSDSAYKTIGEVVKIVGLKSKRGDTSPKTPVKDKSFLIKN